MQKLTRQGLEIELPDGWDARIYRREAEVDAVTRRALHAANFALPSGLGDYAVDAAESMTAGDVLVVLLEFDPDRAGQGLFRNEGLPTGLGDYAVDAVEQMTTGDVLVVLLEFDPDRAGQGLFRNEGLPTGLGAGDFSPTAMPKAVPGRTAAQWFFSSGGRAFCLYVVLGSHAGRADMMPLVNQVVQTLKIEE